jgi:glycopeptide antibiotics resistance protein
VRSATIAIAMWFAALIYMTMRPTSSGRARLNLAPFIGGGRESARDDLLNVALFVPLGLMLATTGWRALRTLVVAFAISLAVEITQYVVGSRRTADVNDLITNVSGAALGWVLAWAIRRERSATVR